MDKSLRIAIPSLDESNVVIGWDVVSNTSQLSLIFSLSKDETEWFSSSFTSDSTEWLKPISLLVSLLLFFSRTASGVGWYAGVLSSLKLFDESPSLFEEDALGALKK